jgi:hypothetical protein
MFLRDLMRFLFPRQRLWLNHGGRLINPYKLPGAEEEEKTLILAGVARSPDDARLMLYKHKTEDAADVLAVVARRKKRTTFRRQLAHLIRRLDGHDPRNPYGRNYGGEQIRVQYRYRGRK